MDTQLVTYPYLIFQKKDIWMESLKMWIKNPIVNKTFENLKKFTREEYWELQAVGELTIQSSSLNLIRELKEYQE